MCCKPSPLFEPDKIISNLPFSIGPGTISETAQSVLQLLVNLCKDPVAALALVPNGSGPCITATSSEGVVSSIQFSELKKLSSYWSTLLQFASDLGCCENFLSAMEPSAPCLLCHPYRECVMFISSPFHFFFCVQRTWLNKWRYESPVGMKYGHLL